MEEKVCFKCNIKKPLSEYYVHKKMADGHIGKCKGCARLDSKKREDILVLNPEWKEKEAARHREKSRNRNKGPHPDLKKKYNENYNEKYPEKRKAKALSYRIKPKTEGNTLHHWSYREEDANDLIELPWKDHKKAHRFLVYDQERMMYRRSDNNELLDTREAHEAYIFHCIETKPD